MWGLAFLLSAFSLFHVWGGTQVEHCLSLPENHTLSIYPGPVSRISEVCVNTRLSQFFLSFIYQLPIFNYLWYLSFDQYNFLIRQGHVRCQAGNTKIWMQTSKTLVDEQSDGGTKLVCRYAGVTEEGRALLVQTHNEARNKVVMNF